MIMPAHYKITTKLYESARSLIYRGQDCSENQKAVILKILKEDYPSPTELNCYKREYEITSHLDLNRVVKAYRLERCQNTLMIVFEDFDGCSLKKIIEKQKFNIFESLSIALQIVESLNEIHTAHIIHQNINPANIIFNPDTQQLKITDFGIATRITALESDLKCPERLQGTLAYLSPEQSGRVNQAIDYRTDFYALGGTLYELFTHHVPFETEDTLELIHCHLAKQPTLPHHLNPQIPATISRIIMKLLEKTAEARYQSIWGIKADLKVCLQQLQSQGEIKHFNPGYQDILTQLQLPQNIYGREKEIAALLAGFERVSAGQSELILLTGPEGIGKSCLVREVYQTIAQKSGYFTSGKFNKFQQNIPYSALLAAFQDLIQQLLTEDEQSIAFWRHKILTTLGKNSQVIIELMPEIKLILGDIAVVPQPTESIEPHCFKAVWYRLICLFCQPGCPLVLFLDNLHWADAASLDLITAMIKQTAHLLLIGAAQTETALQIIEQAEVNFSTLSLAPLNLTQINQLIADTFNNPPTQNEALAELVLLKTQGNPFFIKEFLKSLYKEKLITFVLPKTNAKKQQSGYWCWALEKIKTQEITTNVVNFMAMKVQKLSEKNQYLLKLAACLGNPFSLDVLAMVYEKAAQETLIDLWEALTEGLIIEITQQKETIRYKFAHDRVQQAVYSLISHQERLVLHWTIGQKLLHALPVEESETYLFVITDQLNFSKAQFAQQLEVRNHLAILNLLAGRKAKATAAYTAAFQYFQQGATLLEQTGWQSYYDLTLTLTTEAAETAYLCADFSQLTYWTEKALEQAINLLDKVKIYEIQIRAYQAQGQLQEAVQQALYVLGLLGIKFPSRPKRWHILLGFLETKWRLIMTKKRNYFLFGPKSKTDLKIEDFFYLPPMTDTTQLAAMRVLSTLYAVTYKAAPELFPLIVFKQIMLSNQQGHAPESAFAYAAYGLMLYVIGGDIQLCHQFGCLALQLVEQDNIDYKAQTLVLVNAYIRHWKIHAKETLQPLLVAYHHSLENSNIEFAVTAAYTYCYTAYLVGRDLVEHEQEITVYSRKIANFKNENGLRINCLFHQVTLNLLGRSASPYHLTGDSFNEEQILPILLKTNDRNALCLIYFNKLHLCYLFGKYHQSVENAEIAERYLDGIMGLLFTPLFYFYDSLARLAIYPSNRQYQISQFYQQKRILGKITRNQRKMKKWAYSAPMNYLHKYYLIEAERARVLDKPNLALHYYHKAVKLAQENEYLQEEALACELTAKFYLTIKEIQLAHYYLRNAHHIYQRWGALAKVKQLEAHYPEAFLRTHAQTNFSWVAAPTAQNISQSLDLNSIIKAQQTISEEIILDKLLAKLMKIVIQNAGAQQGILLLHRAGQWFIEAQGTAHQKEITVLQAIPVGKLDRPALVLADANHIGMPTTVINYVNRTHKSVVLAHAIQENRFNRDPYILQHQIKSILCMPLLHQSRLTGMLYLENNLATGVFTPTRLEVLNLLSSQIAISIDNAKLYADTQALNEKLRESEERFRIIADTTPIPLVIFRMTNGLILYANAEIETIFGLAAEKLIYQHSIVDFYAEPQEQHALLNIFAQRGWVRHHELQFKKIDNSFICAEIFIQPIAFNNEKVLFCAIYDVTARKNAEEERIRFIKEREAKNAALQLNAKLKQEIQERLRVEADLESAKQKLEKVNQELTHLATLDSLTQLANRRHLDQHLQLEWQRMAREKNPLSFILCDIDYFKRYNDTYGHQAGDDCLRQIAQAMCRAVRRPADLVARYGGEEFAIILPNTNADGAVLVASAMRWEIKLLKLSHAQSAVSKYVTLSMGVSSTIPKSSFSPKILIHSADNALYEAKAQGRNRITFRACDMPS